MLIKFASLRISFLMYLINSYETLLSFPFQPETDSLQEPFFNEDDKNETEKEISSSRVNQAVQKWCKCGKCQTMLTEKGCRCCHEAASHHLNGNVRGGSRIFAMSRLVIVAVNDSWLPDDSNYHKGLHYRC